MQLLDGVRKGDPAQLGGGGCAGKVDITVQHFFEQGLILRADGSVGPERLDLMMAEAFVFGVKLRHPGIERLFDCGGGALMQFTLGLIAPAVVGAL